MTDKPIDRQAYKGYNISIEQSELESYNMRIRTCQERVVSYEGTNYYIDLQGRVYPSLGGDFFALPQITEDEILHGISRLPEIQIAMKELEDYHESKRPKTAPQPAKRFLP